MNLDQGSLLTGIGTLVAIAFSARAIKVARDSAQSTAQVARVELDREHKALEPHVQEGGFAFEEPPHSPGLRYLVYKFCLDPEYAMEAVVRRHADGDPESGRAVASPQGSDGKYVIHIDAWPEGMNDQPWHKLTIRFWPPAPSERRATPWTCRCGLSTVVGDGAGHWDKSVKILPPSFP